MHLVTSSLVDDKDGMSYISKIDMTVSRELYELCTYLRKIELLFEYVLTANGAMPKPLKLMVIE